jgi:hypothetical protein
LALVLAGAAALSSIDAHTSRGVLVAFVFTVGLGHGLVTPSIMAAAYLRLPRPAIPAATTAATIAVRVGSALGGAFFAIVLQLRAPSSDALLTAAGDRLTPAFSGSFWWAFAIAVLAVPPTLMLPLSRSRPRAVHA